MKKPTALMLRALPFFQGLPDETLTVLAEGMWIENYRRGEDLAGRQGEHLDRYRETAWFVCHGVVALYTLTSRGGRKILFFQGPGALLNQEICSTPALAEALFAHYERRLWRLSHQLKNSADIWYAERKMAAKLLKLSGEFGRPGAEGVEINFPLSIQQMADYIGVSRETASRACKRLTDLGLIRYEKKRFCIPDRTRLEGFRKEPSGL